MNTAVLIQAHNNANYILRLAQNNPRTRFYIHIDKKQTPVFHIIKNANLKNIHLIHNRLNVVWGGSSQIYATLSLLKIAMENSNNIFFHLMSAECFPLKSFQKIEQEWLKQPQLNYIESYKSPEHEWRLKMYFPHTNTPYLRTFWGRILTKFFKVASKIITLSKHDPNYYYYGSQWFSINRTTVSKILDIANQTDFFEKFKYTTCADEHAFQIFVRLFDIKHITNDNKRLVIFKNSSSPIYLSKLSINKAIQSEQYWFARKLHEDLAIELLKYHK